MLLPSTVMYILPFERATTWPEMQLYIQPSYPHTSKLPRCHCKTPFPLSLRHHLGFDSPYQTFPFSLTSFSSQDTCNWPLPLSFYCHLPRLSTSKISSAKLCRTNNPSPPTIACMINNSFVKRSSRFGPNQTSQRLISVKFELSCIFPESSLLTSNNFNFSNVSMNIFCNLEGGVVSHFVVEGSKRPVRALKCGMRCRGHGIRRNSCGAE